MERPTVGMTVRRSGARLRSMAKAHGPMYVLLWQAREAQSILLAAAAAQKTFFNDVAAWASTENRALSDVCSCIAELSCLYTAAVSQVAVAYKSFRKEMSLVLEGERRCDTAQRKLQEAENKRLKVRRQVLRVQNRIQTNGGDQARMSGDFNALQTQLAEAERGAERAQMEACATVREQEAVKLVVVKSAVTKLCQSHLKLVSQTNTIFEGGCQVVLEVPEPPPPGDPVSCIIYNGYDQTKSIVERIKSELSLANTSMSFNSSSEATSSSSRSRTRLSLSTSSRPLSTSTPNNSSVWSPDATAPHSPALGVGPNEPPPPYNMSYLSDSNVPSVSPFSQSNCCSHSSAEDAKENVELSYPKTTGLYPVVDVEYRNRTSSASLSSGSSTRFQMRSLSASNSHVLLGNSFDPH